MKSVGARRNGQVKKAQQRVISPRLPLLSYLYYGVGIRALFFLGKRMAYIRLEMWGADGL